MAIATKLASCAVRDSDDDASERRLTTMEKSNRPTNDDDDEEEEEEDCGDGDDGDALDTGNKSVPPQPPVGDVSRRLGRLVAVIWTTTTRPCTTSSLTVDLDAYSRRCTRRRSRRHNRAPDGCRARSSRHRLTNLALPKRSFIVIEYMLSILRFFK